MNVKQRAPDDGIPPPSGSTIDLRFTTPTPDSGVRPTSAVGGSGIPDRESCSRRLGERRRGVERDPRPRDDLARVVAAHVRDFELGRPGLGEGDEAGRGPDRRGALFDAGAADLLDGDGLRECRGHLLQTTYPRRRLLLALEQQCAIERLCRLAGKAEDEPEIERPVSGGLGRADEDGADHSAGCDQRSRLRTLPRWGRTRGTGPRSRRTTRRRSPRGLGQRRSTGVLASIGIDVHFSSSSAG